MLESLFLTLTCLAPKMRHPLSLGLVILGITCVSSIILSKFVISWFGYSLFLVYVGGVLVMFLYVVALSPNFNSSNLKKTVLKSVILFLGFWYMMNNLSKILQMHTFNSFFSSVSSLGQPKIILSVGGLYSNSGVSIMLFILLMLLVTMIMVVKICYYRSGPLRPFN